MIITNSSVETENNEVKKATKNKGLFTILSKVLATLLVLFVVAFAISRYRDTKVVKISVSSILKESRVISELQTLIVPYNTILKVEMPRKNQNAPIEYKYFTAYSGTVTFGLDFKKVKVNEDAENKRITITLPEIKVLETFVDPNSVETIYKKDKKTDIESEFIERRKECDEDLKYKANNDDKIKELAKNSAVSTIKNLLKPITDEMYTDYEIVIE